MHKQCASPRCPSLITSGKWCSLHTPVYVKPNDDEYKRQHVHYASDRHRRWRQMVLNRDSLCQQCLKKGKAVPATVAHHRDMNWLNLDLDNGEGLCVLCHNRDFHKKLRTSVELVDGMAI